MNHRYFVRSKIFTQLRGKTHVVYYILVQDSTDNSKCEGADYMEEMFKDPKMYKTYTGNPLKPDDFANPCGLIAKAYFNEEYELYDPKGLRVTINETGISNQFDQNEFFKRHDNASDIQWIDVENGIIS